MRVLIFSLVYYPRYVAGAEVAIKEITDRISDNSITFDMITLNAGGEKEFEKIGNVNVYRIFNGVNTVSKLLYPFFAYIKALDLTNNKNPEKYDLIWPMMASYAGYAAYLLKRAKNIPILLTIQEGENFGIREGVLNFLFKRIFRSADRIQVISKFLKDWSIQMGAKCPIDIVPNAVNYDLFNKIESRFEIDTLKKRFNKNERDIFMITTSRLAPKNAVNDIISSLVYLPENVKFICIGDGAEKDKLKKQIKDLKLENRVHMLGFVPHDELPKYLHMSDIFIRPALSEGFGLSYVEAMASGIPVITTPVGGIVDFLVDDVTGLFCEVKNPESIADKVNVLIRDNNLRKKIIENADKMVREKYEWSKISSQMESLLKSTKQS